MVSEVGFIVIDVNYMSLSLITAYNSILSDILLENTLMPQRNVPSVFFFWGYAGQYNNYLGKYINILGETEWMRSK
jgi:hypothetical protein